MSPPIPEVDEAIVKKGLALLTSHYVDKPNIRGLLTAFLKRVQDLEDTLWSVISSQLLATPPTGQALDQIGDLVGTKRSGFSDAQFLVFVKMTIRARRSGGRAEDVIQVVALVVAGATYEDFFPAAFFVSTLNITEAFALPIGQGIRMSRAIGTRGVYVWSSWDNSQLFFWGDSGRSAGSGFKDSVSNVPANGLASAMQV